MQIYRYIYPSIVLSNGTPVVAAIREGSDYLILITVSIGPISFSCAVSQPLCIASPACHISCTSRTPSSISFLPIKLCPSFLELGPDSLVHRHKKDLSLMVNVFLHQLFKDTFQCVVILYLPVGDFLMNYTQRSLGMTGI